MATANSRFRRHAIDFNRYQLVWLNDDVNEIGNNLEAQKKLKEITTAFYAFDDCDSCVDYLTDASNQRIILLISDVYSTHIVPVIHDFPQLKAVYVYCTDELISREWIKQYGKVKYVATSLEKVIEQLKRDQYIRERTDENNLILNIYNGETDENPIIQEQRDNRNASFMFFHLFIDILMEMPRNDEKAKQELIEVWQQVHNGNEQGRRVCEEFANDYQSNRAIWWYTRNSFLYRTLNQCLRDHDIDVMFAMRFFLVDLHQQLSALHEHFRESHSSNDKENSILHVYRGQSITIDELNLFRSSQGALITFNSFLSTSTDRQVASLFAASSDTTGLARILFKFEIDTDLSDTESYADISNVSYFQDEEEVLITLGSIFRLNEVKYDEDEQWWIASLSLCARNDFELKELMTEMKDSLSAGGISSLGWLLYRRGDFEKAKQFFQALLVEETTTDIIKANCYRGLGLIAVVRKEFNEALIYFFNSLFLWKKNNIPIGVAETYLFIGEVYLWENEFELALSNEQRALDILLPLDYPKLSSVYRIMANIYRDKNDYNLAIHYYGQALEIDCRHLPDNHENFAITYANMGNTYVKMRQYEEALRCHMKARGIFLKALPSNHPRVAYLEYIIHNTLCQIQLDKL